MNELEITMWSILLDEQNWEEKGVENSLFLLKIAYQAKVILHIKE
jgi:hypothetical protein